MTGIGIRIAIKQDQVTPVLDALLAYTEDLTPAHQVIGGAMVFSTQRRFEEQHGPDGSPWPQSLRALATGGKTLIKSSRLFQSQTYNAFPKRVEWGTDVIYAAFMQDGGTIHHAERKQVNLTRAGSDRFISARTAKRSKKTVFGQEVTIGAHDTEIPARPFLGINENDDATILRSYRDYFRQVAPLEGDV